MVCFKPKKKILQMKNFSTSNEYKKKIETYNLLLHKILITQAYIRFSDLNTEIFCFYNTKTFRKF